MSDYSSIFNSSFGGERSSTQPLFAANIFDGSLTRATEEFFASQVAADKRISATDFFIGQPVTGDFDKDLLALEESLRSSIYQAAPAPNAKARPIDSSEFLFQSNLEEDLASIVRNIDDCVVFNPLGLFSQEISAPAVGTKRQMPKQPPAAHQQPFPEMSAKFAHRQASTSAFPLPSHNDYDMDGRNYRCTHGGCNRTFKRQEHLKRHSRIHTGEKPFVCTFAGCEKTFSRSDNLSQHYRTHFRP